MGNRHCKHLPKLTYESALAALRISEDRGLCQRAVRFLTDLAKQPVTGQDVVHRLILEIATSEGSYYRMRLLTVIVAVGRVDDPADHLRLYRIASRRDRLIGKAVDEAVEALSAHILDDTRCDATRVGRERNTPCTEPEASSDAKASYLATVALSNRGLSRRKIVIKRKLDGMTVHRHLCQYEARLRELVRTDRNRAIPELIEALKSPELAIRDFAVRNLGEFRDRRAVQPLVDLLAGEKKDLIRWHAVVALRRIGGKEVRPHLIAIMNSDHEGEVARKAARIGLGVKDVTNVVLA